jgi:hypothetical protein
VCVTYSKACNAGVVFAHAGIVSDHGADFVCSGDLADIGSTMGPANQNITSVFISSGGNRISDDNFSVPGLPDTRRFTSH